MEFLEWKYHVESLEGIGGYQPLEKHQAKEALLYLHETLGDDFLARCSAGDPCVARHPIAQLLANYAPSSRTRIAEFAGYLRELKGSQNLNGVLARLHDATQFEHDSLLIKVAAKLVGEGLRVRFEPTQPVVNDQRQPDLKLEDTLTGEVVFLEVVRQAPGKREREIADANSAVIAAMSGISFNLCYSVLWRQTPSEDELADIVERMKKCAMRALNERTMVLVEANSLEMAVCHEDVKATLLDAWCKQRGLSSGELLGPTIQFNDTARLKAKIYRKQKQLPMDSANVIVILAADAFLRGGGVARVISEVEDDVFKYDHIHVVIVHGEHGDPREVPFAGYEREHQYTRSFVDGKVGNNLMLVNQRARMRLSDGLLAIFRQIF